ncbi:MAG: GNAT family N-acetyltransferase [Chloroflexota bacterium]|nr:GNAT family N-acetyltransferase [Chloroflexota bacterium]
MAAHGHRLVGSVLLYPPDGRERRPGQVTGGAIALRASPERGKGIARALMAECLRRSRA